MGSENPPKFRPLGSLREEYVNAIEHTLNPYRSPEALRSEVERFLIDCMNLTQTDADTAGRLAAAVAGLNRKRPE